MTQYNSTMWKNPDKEGQLKKQGHVVKNWKQRWFIIKNSMLFYFKNKTSLDKPLGAVPLEDAQINTEPKGKKPFCFEVHSPKINKTFLIQANDKPTMDSWVQAVKTGSIFCVVGEPYNIAHNIHVDFNSETGFVGLPPEWETMLKNGGIAKKDVVENSAAVLDVLKFQAKREEKQKHGRRWCKNLCY
eukprot:TRINITY_DN481_c0_g1_i1.p2 TRINITY_DN481_c0_g1~~TRINITY_DN481_c0_g1_i1.p2  ORF type:complete len:187 (-),score=33.64 TRINITY_DN481_c0_g1_i1:1000-1560(-)